MHVQKLFSRSISSRNDPANKLSTRWLVIAFSHYRNKKETDRSINLLTKDHLIAKEGRAKLRQGPTRRYLEADIMNGAPTP
jgi:hypothetical protein